jgi:hypothetical protein
LIPVLVGLTVKLFNEALPSPEGCGRAPVPSGIIPICAVTAMLYTPALGFHVTVFVATFVATVVDSAHGQVRCAVNV